jgi:hypothetical protein
VTLKYSMSHQATVLTAREGEDEAAKAAAEKAAAEAAAKKTAEDAAAKAKTEADAASAAAAEAQAKKDKGSSLTDTEARLLKENMEKKEALKKAQESLKAWEGLDANEVRKMLEERKQAELEAAARKGEFDKIREQMKADREAALKQKDAEIGTRDASIASLQQQIADLTVGNAFTGSQFVKEDLALTPTKARALYGSHFEFKDGKLVSYDKPTGAKDRAPLVDGNGEPLSFDAAFKKIIDADPEKDSVLRSKVAPGAASTTNSSAEPGASPTAEDNSPKGINRLKAALDKEAAEKTKATKK